MEESFLFLLLSYALTPALSQRERELPTNSWHTVTIQNSLPTTRSTVCFGSDFFLPPGRKHDSSGSSFIHGFSSASSCADADCQSISDGSRVLQRTPLSISRPGTRRTRNDSDRCTITAENLLHGCSERWIVSDDRRRRELESDH